MTPQPQSQPSSPLSTKFRPIPSIDATQIIPLDDPLRTHPIHPSIPSIRTTPTSTNTSLNPLTLRPFTPDDLKHHNYIGLRREFSGSPDEAKRARDEAVTELKGRLDEMEKKAREIERELEEKEKTREIERKVFMKRRGEGTVG